MHILYCKCRAIGQSGGGDGQDQRGYAWRREEPRGHGEVLRPLRAPLEEVCTRATFLMKLLRIIYVCAIIKKYASPTNKFSSVNKHLYTSRNRVRFTCIVLSQNPNISITWNWCAAGRRTSRRTPSTVRCSRRTARTGRSATGRASSSARTASSRAAASFRGTYSYLEAAFETWGPGLLLNSETDGNIRAKVCELRLMIETGDGMEGSENCSTVKHFREH